MPVVIDPAGQRRTAMQLTPKEAVAHGASPVLVYCPHPLLAAANRRIDYSTFLPAESIAHYLERLGIRLDSSPVALRLNDRLIQREDWERTFPVTGDLLAIRARVRGGGGGKNPLRTVLSIAVLIAAPQLGGALAGALNVGTIAGASAGAVFGGVIAVGGSLLVNSVLPPPVGAMHALETPCRS